MRVLRAMKGNPIFKVNTPEEYTRFNALEKLIKDNIPSVIECCLYPSDIKIKYTEGSRTIKYPKNPTIEWLFDKILTLSVSVKEKYVWSKVPVSVQRFCKQAKELQQKGGTVTLENKEYVVRYFKFTGRLGVTKHISNVVIEFMDKLCADTSELQRLHVLAEKHGIK